MKKIILLNLFLIISFLVFSQPNYSKVKIKYEKGLKDILATNGFNLDDGITVKNEFFIAEYSEFELEKLKSLNIAYDVIIPNMTEYYTSRNKNIAPVELRQNKNYPTPQNFHLGSMGGYLTLNEIYAELDEMRQLYPNLITAKASIGTGTTIENRMIYYVKISDNADTDENETEVFYNALTHAREPAGMMHHIYFMWYLLENYETNDEVKYLVDNLEMYFVPCVNPDGYVFNQTNSPNGGGMHRKNCRVTGGSPKGIDLNRNFGYQWGYDDSGSSPNTSSETYRGTAGFSEPETQLVKEFCESHNFVFAQNTHTYSDFLLFSWGYDDYLTVDDTKIRTWGHLMAKENRFEVGTCWQLLYNANGGADDWMYGEQTTKNKIYSYTPESGSSDDGFWPTIDRIEPICAGNMEMNMYFARLALKYVEISDKSPDVINQKTGYFSFDYKAVGLDTNAIFSIELIPVQNIIEVSQPVLITNPNLFATYIDSIYYELNPSITTFDTIQYLIKVSSDEFSKSIPVTKIYGNLVKLFSENGNNLNSWNSQAWGLTTSQSHSPSSSITDSPNGLYQNYENNTITLDQTIELSNTNWAMVTFWAKWEIESDYDYVQLSISTDNGATWEPLAGNYTRLGGSNHSGAQGQPLYDGIQNVWVKETISLVNYIGSSVKFKFQLRSDSYINKDGFYFDDFEVIKIGASQSAPVVSSFPANFTINEDVPQLFDFTSYVNDDDNTYDQISISVQPNEKIQVIKTSNMVQISNKIQDWNGNQQVTFIFSDGTFNTLKTAEIICNPVNDAPVILSQNPFESQMNTTFGLTLNNLNYIDVDNPASDLVITIGNGLNYTVDNGLITPATGFLGLLNIPVQISDLETISQPLDFNANIIESVGISEVNNKDYVIYPNPNSGTFFVKSNFVIDRNLIKIFDITGKKVFEIETNSSNQIINMENYPKGIYFIQITGKQNFSTKIMVH